MPNIIDTQQLQATAQVAKSYILEQDTANVTTIINALQQGGGSTPAPAGKQEGIITVANSAGQPVTNGDMSFNGGDDFTFTCNSDAPCIYYHLSMMNEAATIASGGSVYIDERYNVHAWTHATDNFTAASFFFYADD